MSRLSQTLSAYAVTPHGLLAMAVILCGFALYVKSIRTHQLSPPTISGHWLFKNTELLGSPWRAVLLYNEYAPQYGDIIQLSTPFKKVVVLNSLQAVSDVLEKQSSVSSDRPRNVMLLDICGFASNTGFRNHDERQKKYRRVMASALHPAAARSYAHLHATTSAFFLRDIAERIHVLSDGDEVAIESSPSALLVASIQDAIGRFIMHMTYGHIVVENDPLMQRVLRQADFLLTGLAKHYWVNDFPILRYIPSWFPGAGFQREAIYRRQQREMIASEPFEAVLKDLSEGTIKSLSYTSKLLESKGGADSSEEDLELVRSTAQSMFFAGSTTTVAVIHSFLFMMSIYPNIAARVQAEIDAQVGRDRLPVLQDRESMPYMGAVLQEVIRYNPVFPLGVQHCASEDFEVRGYTIKKGTSIEGNIWALMHDPSSYPDPYTFNPDRFLKQTPDPDPHRFLFGFGRRVCPGQHISNNGSFMMCAAFMSVFNIVAGEETMQAARKHREELWRMFAPYGAFEPRPFVCTITPRDQAALAVLRTCKEGEVIN